MRGDFRAECVAHDEHERTLRLVLLEEQAREQARRRDARGESERKGEAALHA